MTRRVAFHQGIDAGSSSYDTIDLTKNKMPKLRTFLDFSQHSFMGKGFLLLRVLELRNTNIRDLPTDLKNMIHLTYLLLSCPKVTIIPSWIGNLQNLQTFNISDTEIRELPKSFWKITSLRHVHSSVFPRLVGPPSTAKLVNLRSLIGFLVPKSWKKSFPHLLGVRELELNCDDDIDGMLIHDLQSKLNSILSVRFNIFYPPRGMINFSTSPNYQNIHTVYLSGCKPGDPPPIVHIAEMPPNLANLTLECFRLNDDPMPKLEKLRGLKCLRLEDIRMEVDTIVCTCGGFPQLQKLELIGVNEMKEWKVEYGALPMLKYHLIQCCQDLRALPDIQCMRSKIKNKSGVEWDKVKHIPTIIRVHIFNPND